MVNIQSVKRLLHSVENKKKLFIIIWNDNPLFFKPNFVVIHQQRVLTFEICGWSPYFFFSGKSYGNLCHFLRAHPPFCFCVYNFLYFFRCYIQFPLKQLSLRKPALVVTFLFLSWGTPLPMPIKRIAGPPKQYLPWVRRYVLDVVVWCWTVVRFGILGGGGMVLMQTRKHYYL